MLMRHGFLSRETIGESRCARPIDMLCIGNRDKQVLIAGAFHGMEWITSALLLKFTDEICETVKKGGSIFERTVRYVLCFGGQICPHDHGDGERPLAVSCL